MDSGKFKGEIVPVPVPGKSGEVLFDTDETPRRETTLEQLAKLKPVYTGASAQRAIRRARTTGSSDPPDDARKGKSARG